MYKVRNKTKGFTVLELILALAIGAMFSAIFFQFFFIHQKSLNTTVIKSQLQMDMQQCMDYFTKSAMETSRITSLNSTTSSSAINLNTVSAPQKLVVTKLTDVTEATEDKGIIFSVEDSNHVPQYTYKYWLEGNNLCYIKSGSIKKIICNDVSYVQITSIDGNSFAECSGIVLEIKLIGEDGNTFYDISNNMYFRNKN